jgi:protoporphyrinogen IX oxidase
MHVLYLKALHIIFVITWFAGLFYLVRLFIYHTEANSKTEPERSILVNHFKGAERRLLFGITLPSMILTYVFGFWLAFEMFGTEFPKWLWIKLAFVLGLTLYHLQCHSMYRNLQRNKFKYTSFQLRMWNEVATVFLFAIVFIVVIKEGNWWSGLIGLIALSLLLYVGIINYKKKRESAERKG